MHEPTLIGITHILGKYKIMIMSFSIILDVIYGSSLPLLLCLSPSSIKAPSLSFPFPSSCQYKPVQLHVASEVMDPGTEATIVTCLNQHHSYLHSKHVYPHNSVTMTPHQSNPFPSRRRPSQKATTSQNAENH